MDMSKDINTFVRSMQPDAIIGFDQKISSIPGLIKLTLGEPDLPTPDHIKRAAIKAIEDDHSHYTNPKGILPLRINAAKFLQTKYHLNYDPQTEITVTVGVSEAIHDIFNAILNPGEEVIVPTPIYSVYIPNIEATGAKAVLVNTAKDNFKLTPQVLSTTLAQHPQTKALVLNYPNNPVGNTYTQDELKALAAVIKKHKMFVVCDEIYSELTYDHPHVSLASFIPDQTIVMNGVSKTFAMTGWRIGLVCGPQKIVEAISNVHCAAVTSATTCAQYAANEAFQNGYDDCPKMRAIYRKRRDVLRNGLAKAGFTSPEPSGAFYIFAKIPSQFNQDSFKFGYQLAKGARVGTIPGNVFGPGGNGYLRMSYAASLSSIKEVVKRIQAFVAKHQT